jgi:hypothetical protein
MKKRVADIASHRVNVIRKILDLSCAADIFDVNIPSVPTSFASLTLDKVTIQNGRIIPQRAPVQFTSDHIQLLRHAINRVLEVRHLSFTSTSTCCERSPAATAFFTLERYGPHLICEI